MRGELGEDVEADGLEGCVRWVLEEEGLGEEGLGR